MKNKNDNNINDNDNDNDIVFENLEYIMKNVIKKLSNRKRLI